MSNIRGMFEKPLKASFPRAVQFLDLIEDKLLLSACKAVIPLKHFWGFFAFQFIFFYIVNGFLS